MTVQTRFPKGENFNRAVENAKNFRLRRAKKHKNKRKILVSKYFSEKTPPEGRRKFLGEKCGGRGKTFKKTLIDPLPFISEPIWPEVDYSSHSLK